MRKLTTPIRRNRRRRRSEDPTVALTYQLAACRGDAGLQALLIADDSGLPLASIGDPATCDELAAQIPILGRKVERFEGTMLGPWRGSRLVMRRFTIGDSDLYAAAIGGDPARAPAQVERTVAGATRILAA